MSVYDEKPWLGRYPDAMPETIEIPFENGLAMFRSTVGRIPDSTAIHYFDSEISFRELDELSSGLAAALIERGFAKGDRLAVYLQNVPQFPLAMLATWKAGGTMVSVNPMLKGREVSTILNDSEAFRTKGFSSACREIGAKRWFAIAWWSNGLGGTVIAKEKNRTRRVDKGKSGQALKTAVSGGFGGGILSQDLKQASHSFGGTELRL